MDVRQFAFLARQASARIQPREQFCGLPKRGLALLLANVMFWQPLWAQAEGIVVSGTGTRLQQAGNGVPIVNIATPDATGLSHNQYKDYNVGSQGVILNNATSRTQNTQLGGIIVGNPNLAGSAAHVILNEVTGGNPSQLRGYTEVAGQSAKVIVANPYGMTCNGCGFINTPQVTLTTGKPIVEKGQLQRYQVDGGAISIDGQGLNASNVDGFEIITRSARINAQINARNLTIVTGRNDVDATTLHATARADDGSTKPQLAIDSSALGGMYAGAIKLVGTEAGVGVKLAGNLAASAGDIQLDANGHLRLAQAAASGAVNIAAQSLDAQGPVYAGSQVRAQTRDDLTISNTLAARDSIALTSGGQLTNSGIIEAGVNADDSRNAWGDVHLKAQGLNNRNSVIATDQGLTLSSASLDNSQGGRINAKGALNLTTGAFNNDGGVVSSANTLDLTADAVSKRLGDGFYEQKLIQQALVARTGQRFIDGQHSDEALFKYLMNNAVASKQQLNLSVGTTLTPAQVAALTHDIVWLEEYEVNGEKVLVPVLYLAHANGRVGPNGALVAGRDVNLISGNALTNAGTLKASNNLSASAGNNLVNSGLVQAGNRLDLLAGNTLVNQAGGVIAGRDVSLTAVNGNVINERTVTSHQSSGSYRSERKDFADTAARIEAANDLSVWAGRDVSNVGGVLQSGNDLTLAAGRDINVTSAEQVASNDRGRKANSSSVTQLGSSVAAGRDVIATAGRDLTAIASDIDAKRDIALAAVGDLTLGSAADERHAYFKSKKVTAQEDHVSQVGTSLTAGGDIALTAGKDMALVSSRITAGDEAYLYAGENLELLAAQDSDYSLYDKKKKGSLGSKQTQRDETTSVTNVGTEIKTGGNLTLESGGDQKYQAAKLESGKDLTLESGGAIDFAGVKDLEQESHQKSSSDLAWTSMGSKGTTDETLRQSELVAQGTLAIKASAGLNIDIKHIDQNTVSQTIDAMVHADPQLAWLKEAEARGDVNWQQIREVHESFKYDHSGLGQGAMLVIIIIVSVLTAGVASGAAASAGGALGASSTGTMAAATATASAGLGNMAATAALTSMASTATVSAINNKGKVGDTLSDTFSSNSIKGYALAAASAGVAGQLGYDPTQLGFNMDSAGTVAVKAGADSLAQTALSGGSLSDNFASSMISALITAAGAQGANALGNSAMVEGSPSKIAAHALLGGMKSLAMGQDFKTGALAGGANEAMVNYLADLVMPEGYEPGKSGAEQAKANLLALSKVVGVLSSVVTGGDPEVAANIAATATQYNHLNHSDLTRAAQELNACATNDGGCAQDVLQRFVTLSREQEIAAFLSCAANPDSCASTSSMVANAQARAEQLKDLAATAVAPNAQQVFALLLAENNEVQNALAQVTAGAQIDSVVQDLQNRLGFSDARKEMIRDAIVVSASMGVVGKAGRGGTKEVAGVPKSPNFTNAITDAEAGTSGLPKLGSLKGEPELPPKNASPDMVRSIERQNEASKKLAQAGFDVEQLANTGRKGGNPDLRINGDLADVFSPRTNSPISVLMTVTEKVEKQASSVVVNLADSPLTFGEIEKALLSRPVEGLKKLYLMKNNEFRVIEASK